jgi:hypothetical protein
VSPRLGKGLLTEDEARQARDWVTGTTPEQQGLPWALWTRRAVRELIERRSGKRLGLTTVQLYLQRWGMSPQKPLVRAKERSPAAIQKWLERDYPAIAKRAKSQRAMICWGDETGISNQDQIGRSWAPRGRTSSGPRLNGTPRKRTSSAAEVDHDDRDDGYGCGRTWPGWADVPAAQAGGRAAAAARRGPRDGLALARGDGGGADRLA